MSSDWLQDADRPEHRIISCLCMLMLQLARLTYKRAPGKAHSRQIAVKLKVRGWHASVLEHLRLRALPLIFALCCAVLCILSPRLAPTASWFIMS